VLSADLYMAQWDRQIGGKIASWKARLQPLLIIQVSDWSKNSNPLLILKESRPTYSVKSHAQEILHKYATDESGQTDKSNVGQTMSMNELVTGQKEWEVCRSFVTMLHMVYYY
jgi:hypothetical protein